jgi:hypothetical protein
MSSVEWSMRWATSSAAGKRRLTPAAAVLALGLILAGAAAAPRPAATVTGQVVDGATWQALSGVTVTWHQLRAVTGAGGSYRLIVPPGVRTLTYTAPGRAAARKTVVIRAAETPVRLDAILPPPGPAPPLRLAVNRGLFLTPAGKVLPADAKPASSLFLADAYGNQDRPLRLNLRGFNAYSPVWSADGRAVYYGADGTFSKPADRKHLGVFRHDPATGATEAVYRGQGVRHLALQPDGGALAAAGLKSMYVLDAAARPNPSQRPVFNTGNGRDWLLSVAWGPAEWIYCTVDEQVPLNDRQSVSRPRIVRVHPDGSGLEPRWATADQAGCRYPLPLPEGAVLYGRHALDGSGQEIWTRPAGGGAEQKLAEPALRPVRLDAANHRLYYIHRQNLHLRDLRTGLDLVLVQSVEQADCRRD